MADKLSDNAGEFLLWWYGNPAKLPTGDADEASYGDLLQSFPGIAKWSLNVLQ